MSDTAAATPAETTATTPTGRFCWHELLTSDPEAAAAFYGEVIGWGAGEWPEGETPYQLWMNQGVPVGGMMALPEHLAGTGVPPHWLLYVSTPDADACAAKAESLGGTVLEMVDVDQVGRMAVLKDPLDAVFIAYQPSDVTPGHDELAQHWPYRADLL
ncbi:MAG: VOC family protein [Gammaproteobacteria bacterium]|nr:VOC family protein [Gammaproteobacteria bacterium]MYK69877.1 VOC family protein [Gammaproteobacteria bacterium]